MLLYLKKTLALIFSLLLLGCSTRSHISKLPRLEEFSRDIATLGYEYPDLVKYSGVERYFSTSIFGMPNAKELVEYWGQPKKKKVNPMSFIPIVNLMHPAGNWYWENEHVLIKAVMDYPVGFGYKPHLWWLIIEKK